MPSDAPQAEYSERLLPSPGIWFSAVALGAAFGLIPAPVSGTAAAVVSILSIVALVTALVVTTPTLTVTQETLRAGRASIPLSLVGAVEKLDPAAMGQARGVDLDARAYLCIRGWLPQGVKVTLSDPEDPTPYWIISSRRPDAVAQAIRVAIDRVGRPD